MHRPGGARPSRTHFDDTRRLVLIGCTLGALGGVGMVLNAVPFMRRIMAVAGGALLAGAFVLLLLSLHYGVNPFHAK